MPFMPYGTVMSYVRNHGGSKAVVTRLVSTPNTTLLRPTDLNPAKICQLSSALEYLHGEDIVHGNLDVVSC